MRRTLYVLVCDICFTSTCIALANRQPIDTYTQSRRFFYLKGRMFGKCERQQNNSRKMMQKTKAIRKKNKNISTRMHHSQFTWMDYINGVGIVIARTHSHELQVAGPNNNHRSQSVAFVGGRNVSDGNSINSSRFHSR